MILIIDNYDSFTYNIYQYVGQFKSNLRVIKNDTISIAELKKGAYLVQFESAFVLKDQTKNKVLKRYELFLYK